MNGTVAFIGTGIMGEPMCGHLLGAGIPVRVWNRTRDKTLSLEQRGGQLCATPSEAVNGAAFVVIMLSSGSVVDQVLFEPDDSGTCVAESLAEGTIVIVMSSIPVDVSRVQAQTLLDKDVHYIDAPVSGGERGARDATLTIMAGGAESVINEARAVLELMGSVTRVGPVGCGQLAKLANQTIVGITIAAVAEALLLARAGGADLDAVCRALAGGFADSTVLREHGERMTTGHFTPGAKAAIQLKDLRTSRELADSLGLELPALQLTEELYRKMCEHGRESLDHSALFLEIEDLAESTSA